MHGDPMHPWILMDGLNLPASSLEPGQPFPAEPEPDGEPDEIRAIWGTLVNLHDVRQFLQGFKPKCRVAHEREQGRPTSAYSIDENEESLYETYLCRMRQTGDMNLNLDLVNIYAYPRARKLPSHLIKYPKEVVAIMDIVQEDSMSEMAERDQEAVLDGMEGAEGDDAIGTIISSNYTVRPYGVIPFNLRDLSPTDTDKLVCVVRAAPVVPEM
ncbi:MCM DNA helicase complex subunit [Marasmius sp. AFHP31]|nr:MCM DNA helicase complex subunit [Marasmius sp. AFHP31]